MTICVVPATYLLSACRYSLSDTGRPVIDSETARFLIDLKSLDLPAPKRAGTKKIKVIVPEVPGPNGQKDVAVTVTIPIVQRKTPHHNFYYYDTARAVFE